ncbi:MAG: DUF389 domain-containing protein [bacterium]|nr:DUF389 domain-containing protein [bacterium]
MKSVFLSNFFEKRKTVETLIDESRVDAGYYLFLFFSTFIVALGLIFGNAVIIMAGMLIAPILSPILSLGMGIATTSRRAIVRSVIILIRTAVLITGISFVVAFLTGQRGITDEMILASSPDIWLFLVAFFSGIVAAYSWIKQNTSVTLPSIALSISIIVPLSAVGIVLGSLPMLHEVLFGATVLFAINLLWVVVASTIVFVLFGFSNLQQWQEKKIEDEKNILAEIKKDKEEAKNAIT